MEKKSSSSPARQGHTSHEENREDLQSAPWAAQAQDEKAAGPPPQRSGVVGRFLALCGKLGDLPEWRFGSGKLHGRTLNWGIGIIASMGFLMFG